MKKLILLFAMMGLAFIEVNAQGLKDVELGDYGLTSPLWGKDKIETTLLGYNGSLNVDKYENKICRITFTFSNNKDFTPKIAAAFAKSLMEKYDNIKLDSYSNGNWEVLGDKSSVGVFISPGYYYGVTYDLYYGEHDAQVIIMDREALKRKYAERDKKESSDF